MTKLFPMINLGRKARGFSLPEILVGIFLIGLLLTMANYSRSPKASNRSNQALAMKLASEFEFARSQAASKNLPVAIGFPSANGTLPAFHSWYRLEGECRPAVTRSTSLGDQIRDDCFFVGHWNLDPAKLKNSTKRNRIVSSELSSGSFSLADWHPFPNDPLFVFLPNGELITNDLPSFDDEFHVVVSGGVSWSNASLTGNPTGGVTQPMRAKLKSSRDTYTLSLNRQGRVRVSKGLLAVSHEVDSSEVLPKLAKPPSLQNDRHSTPLLTSLKSFPEPSPGLAPLGFDSTVAQGGHLTIRIEAEDEDLGDELFFELSASTLAGNAPTPGTFSTRTGRMKFDWEISDSGKWYAMSEWSPDPAAQISDKFEIIAAVTDRDGNTVNSSGTANIQVEVVKDERIFFSSNNGLWSVRSDGSDLKNLVQKPHFTYLSDVSPDGQFMCLRTPVDGWNGNGEALRCINSDGTGEMSIRSNPGEHNLLARYDATGSRLVYSSSAGGGEANIRIMNGDGTGDSPVTSTTGRFNHSARFNSTGDKVAYISSIPGGGLEHEIRVVGINGADDSELLRVPSTPNSKHNVGFLEASSQVTKVELGFGFSGFLGSSANQLGFYLGDHGTFKRVTVDLDAPSSGIPVSVKTGVTKVDYHFQGDRVLYRGLTGSQNRIFIDNSTFTNSREMSLPIPADRPIWGP